MRRASTIGRQLARALTTVVVVGVAAGSAAAQPPCQSERQEEMAVTDAKLCAELNSVIRKPSALPLPEFEEKLHQYLTHFCHRNAAAGWGRDKHFRGTGPRTATLENDQWKTHGFNLHAPTLIWYSPELMAWLKANRPADGSGPSNPPPVPDGAVMIKEMLSEPASHCASADPLKVFPTLGATIMIRDRQATYDGWFWGFDSLSADWAPDWPPPAGNPVPAMGLPYCLNCHSSAQDNMTFASLSNIHGEPGSPINYLSQEFLQPPPGEKAQTLHQKVVAPNPKPYVEAPKSAPDDAVIEALRAYALTMPSKATVDKMPSETYDSTWVSSDGPKPSDTFLTSSQCMACHGAGSTGLQFAMARPDPHGDGLLNLSPYGTWRTSPMGLAGRDPIFFAQLASETQTFHPEIADELEDICLGCHGVAGQRQFHIDQKTADQPCPDFTRNLVNAVPWPADSPGAEHANYGMLARDGITCTACHRMQIGDKAAAAVADDPQNKCVAERQALLNPGLTGFGATFTGSYFVGKPDTIIGPVVKPQPQPMQKAIGNTPAYDHTITSSEMCGTCHTVHLPVVHNGKTLAHVYEQTTYAEWSFSAYRTGKTAEGEALPSGAGTIAKSCQDCHMPNKEADGTPSRSKIASIQETLYYPQVSNGDGPNLEMRDNYSRHTLVGLNVFLIKMAKQFPDVLGIRTNDPTLHHFNGIDPLSLTERSMIEQGATQTAEIRVHDVTVSKDTLNATVRVNSHVGHKFPSGVGFRRAFITFNVRDEAGKVIWSSGRTNAAGVIVDENGNPVDGELWWKDDCSGYASPGKRPHQPHFETITSQNQVQVYQELVSGPLTGGAEPVCGHGAAPAGELTTSFLSICAEVKDNRILPSGYLPEEQRVAIAQALGAGADLGEDAGTTAVGNDPDYVTGGGDALTYAVPLKDLPAGASPATVEATLYYQAIPPFYLQDRLCTAKGSDIERLYYLVGRLNLDGSRAEGWKLRLVESGKVAVPAAN